jgi:hypothetical protein
VKFAYADPPYQGMATRYSREATARGSKSSEVDHPALIARLVADYPDGWALSMKTNSLRSLLPLCPDGVRVLAWMKPFAPAYKGIRPVYTWEPVLVMGGRAKERELMVRDSLVQSPRMGLKPRQTTNALGGKPPAFCRWVLDALGYDPAEDTIDDLFPGTGVMGRVANQGVLSFGTESQVVS